MMNDLFDMFFCSCVQFASVVGVCYLVWNSTGILPSVTMGSSGLKKNVSSIGGLILRNGDELDGRLRGLTSRRKAGCSTGIPLAAREQKQGSDEKP